MEKPNRPVNTSWFGLNDGESEIVDAELLVELLETYRFGKDNVPTGEFRFKAVATAPAPVNTTEIEKEEDNDGSQGQVALVGNKSVGDSTSSLFSSSDPIILETIVSETDSNEEYGSNKESGSDEETGSNKESGSDEETGSNKESGSDEETGSNKESGSDEETGYNWLESSSTNMPNAEKERQQNAENGEIEEEEEEEEKSERSSSENSNLEKLLATQENYELYCPCCSSCITKKVILKKRKRGKHVDLSPDPKPDVLVDEPDEPSDIEEMEPPVKVHVPETHIEDDGQEDKGEGIIFTCFACLKHFIRLGVRFLQFDYMIRGKPVEEPEAVCDEVVSELDERPVDNIKTMIPPSYAATEIDQLDQMTGNVPMTMNRERFAVELLKSTVYGGLTETITSLGVVSSASASGSSTVNTLALAVANLAGGLIVLAQNLQDLRNSSDKEKDRYEELLGKRANFRMHILLAVISYILFGLIPPLVYAFSFYETGIKNYKLVSVFSVSLVCVILLGMIKVYVRKPPNSSESSKSYLKSAAYYTCIVVASSGISYVVGDQMGEYMRKFSWVSLDQASIISPFDKIKPEEYRFTSS